MRYNLYRSGRILIIVLALLHEAVNAQMPEGKITRHSIDSYELNNNNFYGVISYSLVGYSVTINYERMLFPLGRKNVTTAYLRAGAGSWAYWTSGGVGGILAVNLVFFRKSSHLEGGLGIVTLYDRKTYRFVLENHLNTNEPHPLRRDYMINTPGVNLGYRYQDPDHRFIFRFGLSYPEGAYTSLGLTF